MHTRTLALFDLDETLLNGDSDYEWGRFLVERGVLDRQAYEARNTEFYEQYRAGTLDLPKYFAFALAPLARFSREQLDAWHREFMAVKILPLIRPGARPLLERHRGDTRAIITATNAFITRPIATALGVDDLIATELETENGRYTGRPLGTPCFREGKLVKLDQWLASRGERLEDYAQSFCYSDSINDVPLLSRVTNPVAVQPDERLRAHAERHGWPVVSLADGGDSR